MKKLLTLAALLLALTACGSQEPSSEAAQQPSSEASEAAQEPSSGPSQPPTTEAPQQLSKEDTCAELEQAIMIFDSEPSDEQVAELALQLDDLATRASDPLQEPIDTLAGLIVKGQAAAQAGATADPALREQFLASGETVEKECGL
ncbi:hypothetical protein [Arthrobacter antioxidans]|uniref:hypothetical protein n=1 Tax=Arthrobacter antioxidans TaxID=2895818 RepID=UPI001FFE8709|nr:hypothetical protein [Arthrobacter antioxidans]